MKPVSAWIAFLSLLTWIDAAASEDMNFFSLIQADRIEYHDRDELWVWDLQGWVGGDKSKFWWKTEGETDGDEAELQLLYSRAISPFWDLQIGLRHTLEPGPAENSAVVGLQGLAPQWFEIDIAAFVDEDGDFSIRLEAEYDLLLTQRLILQPRLELDSDQERRSLGMRLRYEVRREFAPYIGISWNKEKASADAASIVAGTTFWF